MGQSNYIAAAIAIAFIVYITVKGSLPKYLGILTGSEGFGQDTASAGNAPQQTASAATNSGDSSNDSSTASQTASTGSNSGSTGSASNAAGSTISTATQTLLQQVGGDPSTLIDGVHLLALDTTF